MNIRIMIFLIVFLSMSITSHAKEGDGLNELLGKDKYSPSTFNISKMVNKKIDANVYDLLNYQVGDVLLSDLAQVNYTSTALIDFINSGNEVVADVNHNMMKLPKSTQNNFDAKFQPAFNEMQNLIKVSNEVGVKNSFTLMDSFIETGKAMGDIALATPTIAKYEAMALPGTQALYAQYKIYKETYGTSKAAYNQIVLLKEAPELVATVVTSIGKMVAAIGMDGVDSFKDKEKRKQLTFTLIDSLKELNEALAKAKLGNKSSFLEKAGILSDALQIADAFSELSKETRIAGELESLMSGELMDKYETDIVVKRLASNSFGHILDLVSKSLSLADKMNIKVGEIGEGIDDFRKVFDIFKNQEDRLYDRKLKEIYDAKVEKKDKLITAALHLSNTYSKMDKFLYTELILTDHDSCAGPNPPAPCAPTLPKVMSFTTQGVNSHIGSAQGLLGTFKSGQVNQSVKVYSYAANDKIKTGAEQVALAQNTQAFDVLQDWTVTEGDQAKHFSIGNSFGSITAPDPNKPTIAALNNADMQQTTMTKVYKVPVGTKQVNVGMLANFVTNEYPEYVGSQYNDKAVIEIKTGSGNVYQATLYNKELNSANFAPVTGLPSPMDSTGGQTGFEAVNKTINVANGGNLTITVKTMNVGDMAVPSATLINATSVK